MTPYTDRSVIVTRKVSKVARGIVSGLVLKVRAYLSLSAGVVFVIIADEQKLKGLTPRLTKTATSSLGPITGPNIHVVVC